MQGPRHELNGVREWRAHCVPMIRLTTSFIRVAAPTSSETNTERFPMALSSAVAASKTERSPAAMKISVPVAAGPLLPDTLCLAKRVEHSVCVSHGAACG